MQHFTLLSAEETQNFWRWRIGSSLETPPTSLLDKLQKTDLNESQRELLTQLKTQLAPSTSNTNKVSGGDPEPKALTTTDDSTYTRIAELYLKGHYQWVWVSVIKV